MWPAFADLMLLLAVSTLAIAGCIVLRALHETKVLEDQRRGLRDRIAACEARLAELAPVDRHPPEECGLATPIVQTMSDCLTAEHVPFERRSCSLSIEGAIQFEFNKTVLADAAKGQARRIAACIIRGAREVARIDREALRDTGNRTQGVGLDAISIEGHADRCGYSGWGQLSKDGIDQPASRAKEVYQLVYEMLVSPDRPIAEDERLDILSRIATRSFGPYRPLAASNCDCQKGGTQCVSDRRVEIIVQGRIGSGRPNWVRLPSVQFYTGADHQ